jgi:hypothetical protein
MYLPPSPPIHDPINGFTPIFPNNKAVPRSITPDIAALLSTY